MDVMTSTFNTFLEERKGQYLYISNQSSKKKSHLESVKLTKESQAFLNMWSLSTWQVVTVLLPGFL